MAGVWQRMCQLDNEVFHFLIVNSVSIPRTNPHHYALKPVPSMGSLARIVSQLETTINHRLCRVFRLFHLDGRLTKKRRDLAIFYFA